jgi:hypothetical protein
MHKTTIAKFRQAVEDGDSAAVLSTFASDITFYGAATGAFKGLDTVSRLIPNLLKTWQDLRYLAELHSDDDDLVGLVFVASVGGIRAQAVDLLRFNDQGQINELSAYVRPLRAVHALVDAMRQERADYQSDAIRDV